MYMSFESIDDNHFVLKKNNQLIVYGTKGTFIIGVHHKRTDILVLQSKLNNDKYTIKISDLGVTDKLKALRDITEIISKTEVVSNTDSVNSQIITSGLFLHPCVDNVENSFFSVNSNQDIVLCGSCFDKETTVEITGQTVNSVTYVSSNELIVNVTVGDELGTFDIIVKNNSLYYNKLAGIEVGVRELYDVNWQDENKYASVDETGKILTKANIYGWNGGAMSDKGIFSSDGYMEFEPVFPDSNRRYMIGLSYTDKGYSYGDIQYAFYFNTKNIYIYESGKNVISLGNNWESGDKFKISIENGEIYYRKNNIFLYKSSEKEFEYPLFVDTSLYEKGMSLTNVKLFGKLIEI